jgi:hypothetical protein
MSCDIFVTPRPIRQWPGFPRVRPAGIPCDFGGPRRPGSMRQSAFLNWTVFVSEPGSASPQTARLSV